jgi:hypothetical protein
VSAPLSWCARCTKRTTQPGRMVCVGCDEEMRAGTVVPEYQQVLDALGRGDEKIAPLPACHSECAEYPWPLEDGGIACHFAYIEHPKRG